MLDHAGRSWRPDASQVTALQLAYYRDRGWLLRLVYATIYVFNWFLIRLLFRLTVVGNDQLPATGPFVLTPNHASPLDPPVLAAAMPLGLLQNTYWAGKESTVLRNRVRRVFSRLTRVIPVAEDKSSLSAGIMLLENGHGVVWFPEGRRSLDGQLHRFKPGIALLLARCDVPIVPVLIEGAHEAYPGRGAAFRLRQRISVRFGPPLTRKQLGIQDASNVAVQPILQNLRRHIRELSTSYADMCDQTRDHSAS